MFVGRVRVDQNPRKNATTGLYVGLFAVVGTGYSEFIATPPMFRKLPLARVYIYILVVYGLTVEFIVCMLLVVDGCCSCVGGVLVADNGDVYQVVDESTFQGQKALNVYFYLLQSPTLGFSATDVALSFIDQVLPDVVAFQADDVVHTRIIARNLFNTSDAHTELVSEAGANTAQVVGTFEAYPFRLVGDNPAVRNGAKRYAGVTEDAIAEGVVTAGGALTALGVLGDQLSEPLDAGILDAASLVPIIVKRLLSGGLYGLPTTPEELVFSIITDALFSALVSSQTSRKIGVGE